MRPLPPAMRRGSGDDGREQPRARRPSFQGRETDARGGGGSEAWPGHLREHLPSTGATTGDEPRRRQDRPPSPTPRDRDPRRPGSGGGRTPAQSLHRDDGKWDHDGYKEVRNTSLQDTSL